MMGQYRSVSHTASRINARARLLKCVRQHRYGGFKIKIKIKHYKNIEKQ